MSVIHYRLDQGSPVGEWAADRVRAPVAADRELAQQMAADDAVVEIPRRTRDAEFTTAGWYLQATLTALVLRAAEAIGVPVTGATDITRGSISTEPLIAILQERLGGRRDGWMPEAERSDDQEVEGRTYRYPGGMM